MTVKAAPGSVTEFHRLDMAAAALHGRMRVAQREFRKRVIECFAIELNDVGISALVIGVTMVAVLLHGIPLASMKPLGR